MVVYKDREPPPGLTGEALEGLRQRLQGPLVTPADAEYEAARRTWNHRMNRFGCRRPLSRCQRCKALMRARTPVITPRQTRLVRVADLRKRSARHCQLCACSAAASIGPIVGADARRRAPAAADAAAAERGAAAERQRARRYDRLHAGWRPPPPTDGVRVATSSAGRRPAGEPGRAGPAVPAPAQARREILRFYDLLRRQSQQCSGSRS